MEDRGEEYRWLLRVVLPEMKVGEVVEFPSDEAHHLRVRRVDLNAHFLATDGRGSEALCRLVSVDPVRAVVEEVYSPIHREFRNPPVLAFGVVKDTAFEWAIKGAVEVGIREFIPVLTTRSLPEVSLSKQRRWQRVAIEAMKQCGGVLAPRVNSPVRLEELRDWQGAFLSPSAKEGLLDGCCHAQLFLVGPEGGFTPEEEEMMLGWGWERYGLGPRILRTGTAMVTVAAIVAQRRWGER